MKPEDRIGGNRTWSAGRWGGGWRSDSWASARGLWKRPSPEEEAEDDRSWCEAACESGGLPRVLWCELCQLISDLVPRWLRRARGPRLLARAEPRRPSRPVPSPLPPPAAPEQSEG